MSNFNTFLTSIGRPAIKDPACPAIDSLERLRSIEKELGIELPAPDAIASDGGAIAGEPETQEGGADDES